MKHKKYSLPAGLIAVLIGMISISPAQVGIPEIFPFTKEFTILTKTVGGFNFDNDEYLDIVAIAALVDKKGKTVPRSSYLVYLEESTSNDFVIQWKYAVPSDLMADFVDIAVTDMDGDALPEIAAVLNISDVGESSRADWLVVFEYTDGFPGEPTARMEGAGEFVTRPRPMFLDAGDLDGDNNTDLIVSSGGPGRGIIVISADGQIESDNLGILYQTGTLPALQGVLSFRAITANLDSAPGQELVILGGDDQLTVEVYVYEIPKPVIKHTISSINRRDFLLEKLASGDIDGDGYDELIIPRKSGGAILLTLQAEQLTETPLIPDRTKINTLMIVDINGDDLDELLYSEVDATSVIQLEYDMSDILTEIHSYRKSDYDNPILKSFQYIDMVPVVSVSGKVTGSIILPFLNTNFVKHGLCRWQLEDAAPFVEEGPIDEVLGEVDQVLELKATPVLLDESVQRVSGDEIIEDLSGVVGEEAMLSPLPTTKTGMVSKMSISQVFQPDILTHPGEQVIRHIDIEDLALDDLVDLTLDVDIPDGMKFDLPNKVFTWVPADTQLGLYSIQAEFKWSNKSSIQAFTVYVNDRPEITTEIPLRDIIQIGETFRLAITVSDSNVNPFVGYKLVNYPDGAMINADGILTWKPSFDQKDWSDFIVEVSDGYDRDRLDFALFVNHPVDIQSAAPAQTSIGAEYHYQPLLNDKNAGFFVYWYDLSPRITDWRKSGIYELKVIDEAVRSDLDRHVNRFKSEFIPDLDPAKDEVKNHLIDDVFIYEDKLILVFNVLGDDDPTAEEVISSFFNALGVSIPRYSKPERRYFYTFTAKEYPNGMIMAKTGTFDWIPKQDQFDFHSLSYIVSDGYFTKEEHAQIYVNAAPVIVSSPDTITYVNSLWQYEIITSDLNTDSKLSYELLDSPDGMLVSPQGVISWTPTELQLNRHSYSVRVSDGMDENIQHNSIFVNIKPKILSVPKPVALTNLKWEYQLDAEDSNGDPIALKSVRLPKGAKFDPDTGMLTWKPRKSQRGVNDVVLEVVDIHGWSTLQEFQVHVFHNPGKQRFNFIRNSVAVLSLIGIIVRVTM